MAVLLDRSPPEAGRMAKYVFARRLKQLMKQHGLSQYRLAKNSGLTRQAISYLLSGDHDSDPSWTTVRMLARGLGVSVEAFDALDEEPKRPVRGKGGDA